MRTFGRMARHGLIYRTAFGHDAAGNGFIFAGNFAFLQITHQLRLRGNGFGDDHQARGVLI